MMCNHEGELRKLNKHLFYCKKCKLRFLSYKEGSSYKQQNDELRIEVKKYKAILKILRKRMDFI